MELQDGLYYGKRKKNRFKANLTYQSVHSSASYSRSSKEISLANMEELFIWWNNDEHTDSF